MLHFGLTQREKRSGKKCWELGELLLLQTIRAAFVFCFCVDIVCFCFSRLHAKPCPVPGMLTAPIPAWLFDSAPLLHPALRPTAAAAALLSNPPAGARRHLAPHLHVLRHPWLRRS